MVYILLLVFVDSPIVITEVMSNVQGSETTCGDRNEFVELYNPTSDTIDLAPYHINDFDSDDEICAWDNDSILLTYPNVRIGSMVLYPNSYALILDREYTRPDTIGNPQPYAIPDSTLILTTDDTSIGNGIANNDPIIVYSVADACTTFFGTPHDTLDDFPSDPGDGISWERIDPETGDYSYNWYPCQDPAGCTPGKENAATAAYDLAINEHSIVIAPALVKCGEDARIEFTVKNIGLRAACDYFVTVFDDADRDSAVDASELLADVVGAAIMPHDSVVMFYTYRQPSRGEHCIGLYVNYAYDRNIEDNDAFREFSVTDDLGELTVSPDVFTPNNDGNKDRLQIDFLLPRPGGLLTLYVFDMRGRIVHVLRKKEYWNQTSGTTYWHGEHGTRSAQTGMYIIYLEYEYGGEKIRAKQAAVLAR
jgi:hypothetical protein